MVHLRRLREARPKWAAHLCTYDHPRSIVDPDHPSQSASMPVIIPGHQSEAPVADLGTSILTIVAVAVGPAISAVVITALAPTPEVVVSRAINRSSLISALRGRVGRKPDSDRKDGSEQ